MGTCVLLCDVDEYEGLFMTCFVCRDFLVNDVIGCPNSQHFLVQCHDNGFYLSDSMYICNIVYDFVLYQEGR